MGYTARASDLKDTNSPVRLVSLTDRGAIGIDVGVVGFFKDLEQRRLIVAATLYDLDVWKLG